MSDGTGIEEMEIGKMSPNDNDSINQDEPATETSVQAQVKESIAESGDPNPEGEREAEKPQNVVDINTLTPSTPSQTPPQETTSATTPTTASLTVVPENILSPPKSETQTDETNTATSTSCSPASEGQRSPTVGLGAGDGGGGGGGGGGEAVQMPPEEQQQQKQDPAIINGSIPKSGSINNNNNNNNNNSTNKKTNKSATTSSSSSSAATTQSPRASRTRKPKALPMYESEISDNKMGIKLCIKKSETTSGGDGSPGVTPPIAVQQSPSASKPARKRSRKVKPQDGDATDYEPRKKKGQGGGGGGGGTAGESTEVKTEPIQQSEWAQRLPEDVLYRIFEYVVDREGCLPTLFRLGRVCSLWRQVSLRSTLWRSMDLTTCIKEKYRTELKLKWFVDNRCSSCTDLNVSNWKITDINCFLTKLSSGCPNLTGITLSGWKNFTSDHLAFLVDNMQKLQRLDLSSINVEMNASKSAVGVNSLCSALQTMGSRLTHLYLAHNRLAGIPQIVGILSTHCPNLMLLDLSNVTTQATSHGVLHIEKLQHGCQKLKVLRVTNSHITPSTASMQEIMDSPGFPNLEELSVAALTDESRIISDDHLQRILKSSSKLKLLDVRNCTRLTHESLIRLPAWDIKHLFLSGCSVTRDMGSGLELIASKWAHSLIELDLAWANVQQPLDNALRALAEKGSESPMAHLNLCGSSVSDEAVKDILINCRNMSSINLASCRGLPRGVKRLMQGPQELHELREVLGVQLKDRSGSDSKN